MNYEVYSYWNIEELQGVFNAIAALTASNDFTGLLRVLALIAIASMALAVLAGRARHEDFWRWVFMVAVINGLMIVPKASVILVDRTSTQPPRVVANVPIGLAVIAHTTSKIGDWLTRSFETVFSLPSDIQFNKNGFLFGHRILTEVQNLSPDTVSGVWMKDFQEFWRECVTPDIENGVLSPDTLRTTTDIMGALNNTNPALYVTLSTVGTVPCNPTAYNDLNNRLNNQVVPALLNRLGEITFPADPLKNTLIQNAIMTAYSHSQVMNNTAQTIVRQAVMQAATVNAYCNVFAQVGDSNRAALCYATAQGANQTDFTYQVLSKIAESSMPKLKSAIEMIQYAVFPLIVAFAIVAGHMALPIIRTYVMSMVWVQLWPPLYAIVHYIMSVKMKTYGAQLGSYAGTLAGQADLIKMGVSDQAIAGMLVVAIPPIAAALVKGGEIGLQAVAGLVSAPRTAEKQAAATVKGVEAIGDWAVHQRVTTQMQDGTMKTSFSDGSYVVSSEPAYSRIGISSSLSTSVASQLTQKASETTNAAINEAIAAGEKISSALDTVGRLVQSHRRGESFGQGFSEADTSAVTRAYSEANQIAKDFARSLGISEREATQVLATVAAGGGLTVVKGMLQSAGSSEAAKLDENRFSEISKIATDFRNAIDRVNQIAKKAEFSTSETADISALKEVSASLGQSKEFSKNASANFQISQALQREASLAESNRFEFSRNMTNEFMSFMEKQINPFTGRNFTKEDVAQMDAKNQELLVPYMQKFAQEQAEKIASGYKNNASGINPQAFYDQNSARIAGQAGNVTAFGTTNIGRVESA
ncbi:MAG: conjugal transfer protein TraG N-terminal domain-containing protein, partial [Candidatus Hadarchaeum sp.]